METPRTFLVVGGLAAMLGGVLLFVGEVLDATRPETDTASAEFADPLFPVMVATFLPALFLLVTSLPALYLVQADRARGWGLAAWAVLTLGFTFLIMIFGFFGVFAPALDRIEPGILDRAEDTATGVDWVFMVGFPLFLLGLAGFGAVTIWANVLPRAAGALLVLAALFDVVGEMSPVHLPVTGAIFGAPGLAWLGYATWRRASDRAQ